MAGILSVSRWRTRVTTGVGGIAAVLAGWGIGLFELKTAPTPPALAVGKPITAGEWSLRFDRAAVSDRMPDGSRSIAPDRKAIILYVQATNRTAETSNALPNAIRVVTPIAGIGKQPTPYLLRDRAVGGDLQPALPEEVALVWTVPAGVSLPPSLRFNVDARTYRKFDNLYAQPGWYDAKSAGVVEIPLQAPDQASGGGVS